MVYSSIENPKIKEIKKLQQKKYRDKNNLFVIEGRHMVLEAYKKGCLKELILEQNEVFPLDVNTLYVTNDVLNYISQLESVSPIMGICEKLQETSECGNHILVLDGIQDPGNLGTIIRSAVAFDIDTIILSDDTVDLYNPKVLRASQGMVFYMNFLRRNLIEYLPILKQQQYSILGTKVTHGKSIKTVENLEKFAIIMGNEGSGLREQTQDLCDEFIYIEMNEHCESLNVGVAASIILYELDK